VVAENTLRDIGQNVTPYPTTCYEVLDYSCLVSEMLPVFGQHVPWYRTCNVYRTIRYVASDILYAIQQNVTKYRTTCYVVADNMLRGNGKHVMLQRTTC
jgi:hypothetical protein